MGHLHSRAYFDGRNGGKILAVPFDSEIRFSWSSTPHHTHIDLLGTVCILVWISNTIECKETIDQAHGDGFLWPEEMKAVHHLMMLQNEAFAWDDSQRGRLKEEFFPPVVMPVIPHTPWVMKDIPIAPGLRDKICQMIKQKIEARVYEPFNSSYRSQWFTVLKKDAHSGLPPATEERLKQPGDKEYPPIDPELVDKPKIMHFEYPAKTNNEPGCEDWEPLALEEFADQVDTRGGYLHAVATEVSDFEQELDRARSQEVELRKAVLSQQQTSRMDPVAVLSLSQPLLPTEGTEEDKEADLQAYLEHRKGGESEQWNDLLPIVQSWLQDPSKEPEGLQGWDPDKFKRFARQFFFDPKGRL
ncbi:hypothetical protein E4T56_gene6904 [Termitomyces sp. T112]|nr:hypothetical protein E4T56_gene6904 [Termitomyces sp. T112]